MDEFDLTVFSLDPVDLSKNQGQLINDKIRLVTNETRTTGLKPKLSYLSALRSLRRIVKEFSPDIVHAHYASSYGLLGRLLHPRTFYLSVWGSDVFEFPKRSLIHKKAFRWILKGANNLFSTSLAMAKELSNYTNKPIHVVPFGIDIEKFKPLAKVERTHKLIGIVKALEHVYGIDRLIGVTALLSKEFEGLECHIYGEGSQKEALRDLVNELGIEDVVRFKGYINNDNLPSVLNQFDVFCVLSRQESFGVSAVEAQSCGIPVVATEVGGLPEIVLDGQTGFTVSEDLNEIANRIALLLKDESMVLRFGEIARMEMLRSYDWSKNVETMKEFYRSVC